MGRVLPGVELSIRDALGQPVSDGEVGEIWVRGEQVSGEYLGRSGTVEDGWFNTRDAGRVDADGFLFVQGRLDDVIVRGGENLSPGEIEAVLLDHPAVLEAAVVGIPDVEWGERVVAAVVLRPGDEVTEDELRAHVQGVLRSARTPERIRVQRRAALQRDRQAPPPRPPRRARRRVRPDRPRRNWRARVSALVRAPISGWAT